VKPHAESEGRAALADERGAMALITVFFAVFALAMLYSFVGTVDAVLHRERMQDAVDSATLSSAVMHARSMNFVVLVNIVMAALLAILIAIKMVESLAIIGMVVAAALAWPTFGASLAAIPPLKEVQQTMHTIYDEMKTPIEQILEQLNSLEGTVQTVAPGVALGVAELNLHDNWKPPVDAGIVLGGGSDLPLENDDYGVLCKKGGEIVGEVVMKPFDPLFDAVPLFAPARSGLIAATGEMTGALQGWFCGSNGATPPTFRRTQDRTFPRFPVHEECDDPDKSKEQSEGPCDEAKAFEDASSPDRTTGECRTGQDCGIGGPYDLRMKEARVQCDPTEQPRPFFYWYQTRQGHVRYEWKDGAWVRLEPRYDPPVAYPTDIERPPGDKHIPPCGPAWTLRKVADGYNTVVRRSNDPAEVLPVCSNEAPPALPPLLRTERDPEEPILSEEQTFTEVTNILGCMKRVPLEVGGGSDQAPAGQPNSRSPKKVRGTVDLGDEDFQIRGVVHGSFATGNASRLVRLSLFGKRAPEQPLSRVRVLGDFAVAQGEYFYDGTEQRDAWMWNMSWRGRLKRFRMPESTGLDLGSVCGSECGSFLGALSELEDVIAH
jgi:uncharacterized membrane protein